MARRRGELGLTQQALADALGTSRSKVSQIESAEGFWPAMVGVDRLAQVLQVPAEVLYAARVETGRRRDRGGGTLVDAEIREILGERGSYGRAVRRQRMMLRISQKTLGDAVDVDRTHIALIESGAIQLPALELRRKITAALGVMEEDLLRLRQDDETPPRANRLHVQITDSLQDLTDDEARIVLGLIEGLLQLRGGNE
ncbi:MAG: helix-turn-helix transcriptional regulator [Chloroflexota bacterium]|nr:helix-turn-helix transcriptional regulator [Chloroflexota bacterium]